MSTFAKAYFVLFISVETKLAYSFQYVCCFITLKKLDSNILIRKQFDILCLR
jgi:hypothetical protein